MTETIPAMLAAALRRDPTRPLLTWYDDATGERTELSGATLDNWVAKTANLLADAGHGPGDTAAVLLPPHWQTAAVLLGCWSAGLAVDHGPQPHPVQVQFTSRWHDGAAAWSADERYALGLLALAAPLPVVPDGYSDFVIEVRGHGDHFVPYHPVTPDDPAVAGPAVLTHGEVCRRAADRAAELGIKPADRVLFDAAHHADPLDWLLAPLAVGASVVLCGHLNHVALPRRVTNENVTLTLA